MRNLIIALWLILITAAAFPVVTCVVSGVGEEGLVTVVERESEAGNIRITAIEEKGSKVMYCFSADNGFGVAIFEHYGDKYRYSEGTFSRFGENAAADPSNTANPTGSAKTSDPVDPAHTAYSATPAKTTAQTNPANPTNTAAPANTTAPKNPANPAHTAEPELIMEPVSTAEPDSVGISDTAQTAEAAGTAYTSAETNSAIASHIDVRLDTGWDIYRYEVTSGGARLMEIQKMEGGYRLYAAAGGILAAVTAIYVICVLIKKKRRRT